MGHIKLPVGIECFEDKIRVLCMEVKAMSSSIIGGADGPTSIFLAGQTQPEWINIMGLAVVVLLLIPNIIYAITFCGKGNQCDNKFMNIVEQAGRYASMFLMVFNIGIAEFGFSSAGAFLLYVIGNAALLLIYWIIWLLYFYRQDFWKAMVLALIPVCMFLLSGITLRHGLLIISGVVFGIGHTYVTYQNGKAQR